MHKKTKKSPLQAPSDQDEAGSSDCPASVVWAELGWTPKIANAGVKLEGYFFPNEAYLWYLKLNIEYF